MILEPNNENVTSKVAEAEAEASVPYEGKTLDPPPVYTASDQPSTPPSPARAAAEGSKPTNYVFINRDHSSTKGSYIIDPSINIPLSLLPPLRAGQSEAERKNLHLRSKHGAIDVDVTLLEPRDTAKKPTTLDIHSKHGSVNVKIRTAPSPRTPFHANVSTEHSSLTVCLPRDFEGPFSIYSEHGSVKISDALLERVTASHEANNTRRMYVGDLTSFSEEEGGNKGDELQLKTDWGKVRVRYVDEEDLSVGSVGKGLLSRMFSR